MTRHEKSVELDVFHLIVEVLDYLYLQITNKAHAKRAGITSLCT